MKPNYPNQPWQIAGHTFQSRLFLGTGKFASNQLMCDSITTSGSEMVTIALKRVDQAHLDSDLLSSVKALGVQLLPNTSGARTAEEAVLCAELCREAFETDWLKLEIHPDPKYLLPDPIETLKATEELAKRGFIVLPYINADPILCKRLEDVGTAAVMPLGAPIGSNRGVETRAMIKIIIAQSNVPVIVDAGIGRPSHAAPMPYSLIQLLQLHQIQFEWHKPLNKRLRPAALLMRQTELMYQMWRMLPVHLPNF